MIQQLRKIIEWFESETHNGKVSQFTIDMGETYYEKVHAERDEYFEEQDVLGSLEYSVNNILEIIQQGGDRDLFEQLKTKLSEVEI